MSENLNDYFPCAWCDQSRYLSDDNEEIYCSKNSNVVAWRCFNEECKKENLSNLDTKDIQVLLPYSNKYDLIKKDLLIKNEEVNELTKIFYCCQTLGFYSAAILIARKLIVHIIIDQKICEFTKKMKFSQYYQKLKDSNYIGTKWFDKLDLIRDYGNKENHEISVADEEICNEVEVTLDYILKSIYIK